MPYFNIVAQTSENTVVTEYEPVKARSDSYQSEAELEREFISFFNGVKVLSPKLLVNHVSRKLKDAADMYDER